MQKDRDLQFDIVRVLATLWIVGAWHVLDYLDLPNVQEVRSEYDFVTRFILATFMFMSGYFLSKYKFETKAEINSFYKKRLTRFFPLLAFAALLLYRLGINPGKLQLLLTVTGLSSYFGHQSYTIWFISMLFSFYMVTPVIAKGLEKIRYGVVVKSLLVIVFSIVFIYALSCTSLDYDVRLSYTMPFYGLGLIYGRESIVKKMTSKWYVLVISTLLLISLHYFHITGERFLHIDTVTAIMLFLCVCYWMKFLPISRIISVLSFASMAMYLFHRPVFHLGIKYIFHDDKATIPEVYLVLMPITIVVSYIIQLSYDYCVDKIAHMK